MRIPLKERVNAAVERHFETVRGTGSWLNKGLSFNHSLRLKSDQKEKLDILLDVCGIPKRKENYRNLDILTANLLYKRDIRPLMVSLNVLDWKKTRYTRAGESTTKLIKELHEQGYIELKKGFRNEKEPWKSRISRIWPTDKLLEYFPEYPNDVVYDPVEVVILRDDDRKLIDYNDTARTREVRKILTWANRVNQSADIKYNGFKRYTLYPSLVAIFRRRFTLYGRLHTRGYRHYQGLSSDERKKITINGDPVVELDFSGLHPSLLYANVGIQLYKDAYSLADEWPVSRKFLKHILLCMLNAKDEVTAESSINYWLFRHNYQRVKLNNFGITSVKPLITEFRNAHKPIEHYFCSGSETGLRIMNQDSRIALDIVDHFAKRNIPILAVHDSFIVQEKYEDELRETMGNTYAKHTNGFKCKIK